MDPDPHSKCGSRRATITHKKKEKKVNNFHVSHDPHWDLDPDPRLEKMLAQPRVKDIFCVLRSLEELKKFKNKPRYLV